MTRYRRIERELIGHYRDLMLQATARLNEDRYAATLALARLPDDIRGYEDVKLASVADYAQKAKALAAQLGLTAAFPAGLPQGDSAPLPQPLPADKAA